jgi:hypothetical protein
VFNQAENMRRLGDRDVAQIFRPEGQVHRPDKSPVHGMARFHLHLMPLEPSGSAAVRFLFAPQEGVPRNVMKKKLHDFREGRAGVVLRNAIRAGAIVRKNLSRQSAAKIQPRLRGIPPVVFFRGSVICRWHDFNCFEANPRRR